jgi:hypothetical protein
MYSFRQMNCRSCRLLGWGCECSLGLDLELSYSIVGFKRTESDGTDRQLEQGKTLKLARIACDAPRYKTIVAILTSAKAPTCTTPIKSFHNVETESISTWSSFSLIHRARSIH